MTDLLTLTNIGQREISYRFDILDKEYSVLGNLDVEASSVTITNNINRTLKRQMDGITIPPSAASDINPLTDRLRPMMIMSDGTAWPLGVFVFSEIHRNPWYNGSFQHGTMLDQLMILDQPVNRAVSFKPGTVIRTAIINLLSRSPITQYNVEASSSVIRGTEWVTWAAGTTTLEIINDLCQMASYYTMFFDNDGVGQVILVPDLAKTEATLRYGSDVGEQRVFADTIVETDDLLQAPNRYIVINSSLTDEKVVGFWDVPSTAPNSKEQRGFVVATVVDKQGIDTNAEATAAAKAFGQADFNTFSWATFDAAPDPRHDTFDVIAWFGVNYRMQSDRLACTPEGPHNHEIRRIYNEPTFDE